MNFSNPRPPPVPPHQSKHTSLTQTLPKMDHTDSPRGHVNLTRAEKGLSKNKAFVHHVRTISDSGLRRMNATRKSNTIDAHSSSFNHKKGFSSERSRLIEELRIRHQENHQQQAYLQQQQQMSPLPAPAQNAQHSFSSTLSASQGMAQTVSGGCHEEPPIIQYPSLQRPKVPPPPLPVPSHLSSARTNLPSNTNSMPSHAKQYLEQIQNTSRNDPPPQINNRKQHIYVESSKIRNGQSIESLPSLSSDELSNKYSPIPVPPPRKVKTLFCLKFLM